MPNLQISPSTLSGTLWIPPSKSHTLRALLFSLLAKGKSRILNYLPSPDTSAMIDAISQLGAHVEIEEKSLLVEGTGGRLTAPNSVIDCGNSGQVLRFIGALAALIPSYTLLTGDASIRNNRPVRPLLDALTQLGAIAISSQGNGKAPILIKGPLQKAHATLSGQDSQPVSALLIAASFAPYPIELSVQDPGELPWIGLTLSWLDRLHIPYKHSDSTHYRLSGGASIDGFTYTVPADLSSAAYPIAAALLTQSELILSDLDMEDCQGDRMLIPLLQEMGARIESGHKSLTIKKSPPLQGRAIDVNPFIDALPLLAVIGCFARGETLLYNGAIARQKESDRIHAITTELKKMGALVEERPDGLLIRPSPLRGAALSSHKDHRIALSLTVAALAATGKSSLHNAGVIAKSYPNFSQAFIQIGAAIS